MVSVRQRACSTQPSPLHSSPRARRSRRAAAHGPMVARVARICRLRSMGRQWWTPQKGPHSWPSGVGSRICAAEGKAEGEG